jgi:hypothetical protein
MDDERFPNMDECKSEVARLRYRIDQEYRDAELALAPGSACCQCRPFIIGRLRSRGYRTSWTSGARFIAPACPRTIGTFRYP